MKTNPLLALIISLSLTGIAATATTTQTEHFKVVSESLRMAEVRVPVLFGQGDLIDLNIEISYREDMKQSDYPDFIALKSDLRKWTDSYDWQPKKDERAVYWETMVKDLSIRVIENYPTINVAALSVKVYPNAAYPYPHTLTSVATRPEEDGAPIMAKESIALPITSYGIDHQGPQVIDLYTTLHYNQDLGIREYPPFEEVYAMLFKLMEDYPIESDYWETLIKSMSADILTAYPQFRAIEMDMRVYPTFELSYFHDVYCKTKRAD